MTDTRSVNELVNIALEKERALAEARRLEAEEKEAAQKLEDLVDLAPRIASAIPLLPPQFETIGAHARVARAVERRAGLKAGSTVVVSALSFADNFVLLDITGEWRKALASVSVYGDPSSSGYAFDDTRVESYLKGVTAWDPKSAPAAEAFKVAADMSSLRDRITAALESRRRSVVLASGLPDLSPEERGLLEKSRASLDLWLAGYNEIEEPVRKAKASRRR